MSRTDDARREWFEGLAQKRLGVAVFEGYTDIAIRRERIRRAIIDGRVADVSPIAAIDRPTRTWSELFRLVYGNDLTSPTSRADDPPRQGTHSGNV